MAQIKQRLLSLSILLIGLGLYFPIYKQVYKLYTQCDREHIKAEFKLPTEAEDNRQNLKRNFLKN